jgi:hypothetical protein
MILERLYSRRGHGVPSPNRMENPRSTSIGGVKRSFALMQRHHLPREGVFWSFVFCFFPMNGSTQIAAFHGPHPGSVGGNGGGCGVARLFCLGGRVSAAARRGEGRSGNDNQLRATAGAMYAVAAGKLHISGKVVLQL